VFVLGPQGQKHVEFIDDIIKKSLLWQGNIYTNIKMSKHNVINSIKIDFLNVISINFDIRKVNT
jgi:hypothetical protein